MEVRGKQAGWSKSGLNRKIAPSGSKRKVSGLEQKCAKPEDCSKGKKRKKNMVETRKKHMYNRVT